MSSKHDPCDSLRHIIDNAETVARNLDGLDQHTFQRSAWAAAATERHIERVCEACFRLGDRAEELMPGQPWADIRGMGNRLRHAYDAIDVRVVWETAKLNLPQLAIAAKLALERLTAKQAHADEPAATRKRP